MCRNHINLDTISQEWLSIRTRRLGAEVQDRVLEHPRPLSCALSWRGTDGDDEDSAGGFVVGDEHNGLVGDDDEAVSGLECLLQSGEGGMERASDDVGGEFAFDSAFADGRGDSCGEFEDLRDLLCVRCGDVQGSGALGALCAAGVGVSTACDGQRVVLWLAEEVSEADSVYATDALKGVERGHHVVCFELGEQRGGEAGLRGEAREGEVLGGAEGTEFQANGVDGQWIRRRQGHTTMLAGS